LSATAKGQATPPTTEPAVLIEVTAQERALTELRSIFQGASVNEFGHASKAELTAVLEKAQEMVAHLKEAGMAEMTAFLNRLVGHEGDFVSWAEFEEYATKALVEEVVEDVKVTEKVIITELEAAEEVLRQLKKFFESLKADEGGTVSKDELAVGLMDTDGAKDGTIGNLIRQASFNPLWNMLDKFDTNKDGRISWEEFQAHVRGTATNIAKTVEVAVEDTMVAQGCWRCC
jgi:Ca2+-binding EF-hand superfamily protein